MKSNSNKYFLKLYFVFSAFLFGIYFISTVYIYAFGLALDASFRGSPIKKLCEIYFSHLIIILILNLFFMFIGKGIGYIILNKYEKANKVKIDKNEKESLSIYPLKKAWIAGFISILILTLIIIIFYFITQIKLSPITMSSLYIIVPFSIGYITYIKRIKNNIKEILR